MALPRRSTKPDIGCAQDVGISQRQTQEEIVQVERITTADNSKLIVAIVADGESADGDGQWAAKTAAGHVLRALKNGQGQELSRLLGDALEEAHRAVRREIRQNGLAPAVASVTVAVVQQNRLYLAHSGNSRAYLVRGESVTQLTHDQVNEQGRLTGAIGLEGGLEPDLEAFGLEQDGLRPLLLKRGDRLLVCSDGLIRERPDGKGFLLEETEIPEVVNNPHTPALEAARTLVSLAVGRKAEDNVSAAVIGLPPPINRLWFIVPVAAILLLCLAIRLPGLLAGAIPTPTATVAPTASPTVVNTPTTPADPGNAFVGLIQGTVRLVGAAELARGNTVLPGAEIQSGDNSQAEMLLTDGSRLYLGPNSQLRLEQIDREGAADQTILRLLASELLVKQDGRGDTITILDGGGNPLAGLLGNGALAVRVQDEEVLVECFQGACTAFGTSLTSGNAARRLDPGQLPITEVVSNDDYWANLCRCLPTPEPAATP